MGERTQFFVTLPSNSSMNKFENNTLSNFRVELYNELKFPGGEEQWDVALAEIQYPTTWYNMGDDEHSNYFEVNGRKFHLPEGYYESGEHLVNKMTESLRDYGISNPQFRYDKISKRIHVTNRDAKFVVVIFSENVARLLGYQKAVKLNLLPGEAKYGEGMVTISAGFHSLYVYSNAVAPVHVGDVSARLLRVVPLEESNGGYKSKTFERPHYKPVGLSGSRVIEIRILNDAGHPVRFEAGKVVVTLHFKRSKLQYF